jgi:uncharacterized protein (TIGR00156 family)
MKKTLFAAALLIGTSFVAKGDFVDSNPQKETIYTVAQVKESPDDTWVTLRGTIVKKISNDEYIFKDATGEILVDIDKYEWKGIDVTADTLIQISGKVDQDTFETTEIDVKNIEIVKAPSSPAAK